MSEIVVQMEIPENCLKCPLRNQCEIFCDWFSRVGTSATRKPYPKPFDKGCKIVCQLPKGHGRLIDWDAFERIGFKLCRKTNEGKAELGTPTNESYVVPAERSET